MEAGGGGAVTMPVGSLMVSGLYGNGVEPVSGHKEQVANVATNAAYQHTSAVTILAWFLSLPLQAITEGGVSIAQARSCSLHRDCCTWTDRPHLIALSTLLKHTKK